ncbi:hypothetical protein NARC_10225 [Candidatus Nitrosocosmicus arcticus]|uniref:Uncharacterized protein n=1 Tax=Candidatus Nitrosocosmicus arcticus TaxID=2035267 RepID=A0A557SYY8_9ARCH|nr:hypothetical protein NARC_10225 [Candidatus Nitrosocosmicus arcticus]
MELPFGEKSNSVGYGDGSRGRTVRVNINGGGGLNENQKHDWKVDPGPQFIWTPLHNRNAEFTYYFRTDGKFQGQPGKTNFNHTECSSKLRGGVHIGSNNFKASCVELKFKSVKEIIHLDLTWNTTIRAMCLADQVSPHSSYLQTITLQKVDGLAERQSCGPIWTTIRQLQETIWIQIHLTPLESQRTIGNHYRNSCSLRRVPITNL